jgi:hypothetical protein
LGLLFSWQVQAQVPAIAATASAPPFVLDAMGCPVETASPAGSAAPAAKSVFNDEEIQFLEKVCLKIKFPATTGSQSVLTVFANKIYNRGNRIEITASGSNSPLNDLVFSIPPNAVLTIPQEAAIGRTTWNGFTLYYYATVLNASDIVAFTSDWRPDSMIPTPHQWIRQVLAQLYEIRDQRAAKRNGSPDQAPIEPYDQAH